jgi:Cys-tRNA(Pro) deacylase
LKLRIVPNNVAAQNENQHKYLRRKSGVFSLKLHKFLLLFAYAKLHLTMIDYPVTPAIRTLRAAKAAFTPHVYEYIEKGGTAQSALQLGVEEHIVIKTLIMEDEKKQPMMVLMHGDKEVSTKNLARHLSVKTISPCTPETANRHTNYMVGGTSPFGTRKAMPVYAQATIQILPRIFINGGKRGFLIEITPQVLNEVLKPTWLEIAA